MNNNFTTINQHKKQVQNCTCCMILTHLSPLPSLLRPLNPAHQHLNNT